MLNGFWTNALIEMTCLLLFLLQSEIQVNLQLQISPQHHDIVKGKNNVNLLKIMEQTNTKVCHTFTYDAR